MFNKITNKKWSNGFFIGFFLVSTGVFLKQGNAIMSALDFAILVLNISALITMKE